MEHKNTNIHIFINPIGTLISGETLMKMLNDEGTDEELYAHKNIKAFKKLYTYLANKYKDVTIVSLAHNEDGALKFSEVLYKNKVGYNKVVECVDDSLELNSVIEVLNYYAINKGMGEHLVVDSTSMIHGVNMYSCDPVEGLDEEGVDKFIDYMKLLDFESTALPS